MRDRGIFFGSVALFLLQVASQSSNTPCLVAAFLETVCEPPVEVDAIPPNTHYVGPSLSEATLCRCSTVTYSLISACAGCQNRTFIPWTEWATNCSQVEVGRFLQTIPPEVVIPSWAFLDVTKTANIFNPILANLSLSQSSSSASASATSSSKSIAPTPPSASTPVTLPSPTPTPVSHTKSNSGAIAGGVVGGLVFVVAVGFSTSPPPNMQEFGSRRTGSSPLSITPFPYDSFAKDQSEGDTMPGSPGTSAVHTTFDTPSVGTPAVQILHRYTGSAEL
ncbi:hypothetical protein B0H17DRAFT_234035 [Mycena rosella]|uniref:Transmembrane protein n=1 Tax=Mycena rosella TaxID=1033263 RepID=A0AAD7MBQ0_MYCRO|nr:hypothetical protein B0H17DRAFT_234035 [Mycena rosella]